MVAPKEITKKKMIYCEDTKGAAFVEDGENGRVYECPRDGEGYRLPTEEPHTRGARKEMMAAALKMRNERKKRKLEEWAEHAKRMHAQKMPPGWCKGCD